MGNEHLAVLVRAVARLRGDAANATDDAQLVDALARLIGSAPAEETPARRKLSKGSALVETSDPEIDDDEVDLDDGDIPRLPRELQNAPVADERIRPHDPRLFRPNDPDQLVALPSTLHLTAERADLAAPCVGARSGASDAANAPDVQGPVAPLESLFAPGRVRAILRELATLASPGTEPDIDAIVRLIALGEPIAALPQRVVSTLGHSIQLLFDAGPAMLPFVRDKQQLAASATRLLGRDRVRVADFIGDPLQGFRPQRQARWQPMRWPARRSALVVVSDLGLGSGTAQSHLLTDAWHRFLDEADRRGLRSVLLIPYARERWPAVADGFGTALTWDLATGVQALRRSMRAAATR